MSVFVVPVDASNDANPQEAEVTNQQVILGRSFLVFSCDDTRISRNQGILTHKTAFSDRVTIKATHLNPLYYKVDGSSHIDTLLKEKEVALRDGDQFGFLPDKCWFKISIKKTDLETNNVQAASLMLRVRPLAELNDSQNFPEILPQVMPASSSTSEVSQIVEERDLIVLPTPDFNFEAQNVTSSEVQSNPEQETVRVKREIEDETAENHKKLKTNDVPSTSQASTSAVVKKEEPDSTDEPLRDSCEFGIRCYRRNVEHRRQLAHPGDADYRRPNYPPAPPGSPMCPYAARCYRRNPDHFLEYAHPPSTGPSSCSDGGKASTSTGAPVWLPKPMPQPKNEPESDESEEENVEEEDEGDFSADEADEDFVLNGDQASSDDEIDEIDSNLEESDDNSAILDDGDANED
ncbi:aprataxin and PNK-like factor isoform X2 [Culicoides brevitarsis]|uniref:aprataxin and PNK-like factor isoform X2 n=1 Tax=Culicoides brevitarsis TaxID=469753 RepID=UPI00307BA2EE